MPRTTDVPQRILATLRGSSESADGGRGRTSAELAKATGRSIRQIRIHARHLADAGHLTMLPHPRDGRAWVFFLGGHARRLAPNPADRRWPELTRQGTDMRPQ